MSTIDCSGGVAECTFPAGGLVPKTETGVLSFLQKYPDYDGRDVTIAILDSGVDPRATGLETLCDGKTVKVVERYDCTGCGDVDVSKKVTADAGGFLAGLTGRQLKLTPEMIASNTANGEYHIGMSNFFNLCPSKARENLLNAIKLKEWDGPNKTAIADITRKINEFEAQNTDLTKLSWDKKLIKDDLDFRLEMLNNYNKIYHDVKTTYDCIVYATENGWQTVLDITETGDLANALHLGEYTRTHEIKNVDDYMSVSVNVHDDGNVLEIVGMCTSHGTHVASIASGNHCCKDVNGVAPNAKIISLTIGDGRLGSMETGAALVRAMTKIMELCSTGRQVDVINMSYGEHAHWSNAGRIGELMNEVVNKYGVVWVASAGNHGPALCTVGTPPDISQPSCIGVGAYVSPQMMEAEYSMREKLPANVYTWTSRDPCLDGGQGVTICAPGGAITSVPQYTMSKSQLMNGTSMAAPHVAGAVALLISGLKQKGIQYSPFSIKRAICATATKLSYVDPFAQGSGLLNVEKAFEHLVQHDKSPETMLRFSLRCGPQSGKGIHIREGFLKKPSEISVTIEPIFFNEKEAAPADKFNFNVRLNLISSQPFVQCGAFLDLSYSSRTIVVKVDPSGLTPGVHTAAIRAFESGNVQKGPLFEIPVTVVQPHVINCDESRTFEPISNRGDGSIEFHPNTIQRNFILVPPQATWAVLRMRSTNNKSQEKEIGKFFVHTMQLLPKSSCRIQEHMKIASVNTENETVITFAVQESNIVEVCIAKYWSNLGCTHLKYSVEFHGILPTNTNPFVMHAGRGIFRLEVAALLTEEIQPSIQLKVAAVVLKPTESRISPLSAVRDVLPDGRQIYQNLLSYTLHVPKSNEIALYAPHFNSLLYESEFESQLWMLFDCNKAMIACGDAHSHTFFTKLEKGDYTIKLQVRHEKRELLDKIAEVNMVAVYKLANTLNLDTYDHYNQCIVGGRKFTSCTVRSMAPKVLYMAPFSQDKLNKANLPSNCAWLSGSLALSKDEGVRRIDAHEFMYILNPPESSKKNGNGNANANSNSNGATQNATKAKENGNGPGPGLTPTPSIVGDGAAASTSTTVAESGAAASGTSSPKKNKSIEEYAEGLRDFQCSMITKCDLSKAEQIYEEVLASHPNHLVTHLLLIQNIESTDLKAQFPFTFGNSASECKNEKDAAKPKEDESEDNKKIRAALERIVKLADIVIGDINKDELLAYYGLKNDTRPDAAKIKTNMDKQKSNLLEALSKKGIAITKLSMLDMSVKNRLDDIDNIYVDILKFVEGNDSKVIQFSLWHAYAHDQYGRMYKYLQKLYEDKRNRDNLEELSLVAGALGFAHLETLLRRLTITAYPHTYRIF